MSFFKESVHCLGDWRPATTADLADAGERGVGRLYDCLTSRRQVSGVSHEESGLLM